MAYAQKEDFLTLRMTKACVAIGDSRDGRRLRMRLRKGDVVIGQYENEHASRNTLYVCLFVYNFKDCGYWWIPIHFAKVKRDPIFRDERHWIKFSAAMEKTKWDPGDRLYYLRKVK